VDIDRRRPGIRVRWSLLQLAVVVGGLLPSTGSAQELTGTIVGTIRDEQGGALAGAHVRIESPSLIGGIQTRITNEKGQIRYTALPLGSYSIDIDLQRFAPHKEQGIQVGVGATVELLITLKLAGVEETVKVEGASARIEARDPGFATRLDAEDLGGIPSRRAGGLDLIRAAPGVSPTSPSSGTLSSSVSVFGSSTNENTFQIDGTNFTAAANGAARADPGIDFVQEVRVQSVGASAEYGNAQGALVNIVTKQGGNWLLFDVSYYAQTAGLTSRPMRVPVPGAGDTESGYERARYRDVATTLGGPIARDRVWFFAGYQHLRDSDSQPGTDPRHPRASKQDKIFAKLTWRFAPGWHLVQSVHDEFWVNPEQPTISKPFESTVRFHGAVPAVTFGQLTHASSNDTVWDVRVGRFVYSQYDDPSADNLVTPSRFNRLTNVFSGAPAQIGNLKGIRTTAKSTFSSQQGLLGADHHWKVGAEIEQGEHRSVRGIPTGVRFVDGGSPQAIISAPSNAGGRVKTSAAFASDAVTLGNRLTIDAGLRFDHSRAISQDLLALDAEGQDTGAVITGLGELYTWDVWSPRLGVTAKLTADGRTLMRASYGRYTQGVLTGEISPLHPGVTAVTTYDYVAATGGYTLERSKVDRSNLQLDADIRPPRADEYSIAIDRDIRRQLTAAIAYVHKDGTDFIGWVDLGGRYREETRALADGRNIPASVLISGSTSRLFQLRNPSGYATTYDGLVMTVEKRLSNGWQAFGSYTRSRAEGLQASSGTTAAGAQLSTVGSPPIFFGRDPNDLTHARGRLPNDRPHMVRIMGSLAVPRTGFVVAGNLQNFSGKPWAATTLLSLPQNSQQRVLLEPRGSRRLSAQTLLDLRLSRAIRVAGVGRVELILDVLNVLNDTAEEGLVTDVQATETVRRNEDFGRPSVFIDPRRAMLGVRIHLGR
jgi:hypothetical protein